MLFMCCNVTSLSWQMFDVPRLICLFNCLKFILAYLSHLEWLSLFSFPWIVWDLKFINSISSSKTIIYSSSHLWHDIHEIRIILPMSFGIAEWRLLRSTSNTWFRQISAYFRAKFEPLVMVDVFEYAKMPMFLLLKLQWLWILKILLVTSVKRTSKIVAESLSLLKLRIIYCIVTGYTLTWLLAGIFDCWLVI